MKIQRRNWAGYPVEEFGIQENFEHGGWRILKKKLRVEVSNLGGRLTFVGEEKQEDKDSDYDFY